MAEPKLDVHKCVIVNQDNKPELIAVHFYWAKQKDGSHRPIVSMITDPADMTKQLNFPQVIQNSIEKAILENVEPPK